MSAARFTFGRMNPPTKGHMKLFDGSITVFVSKSYNDKNPLTPESKVNYIKEIYNTTAIPASGLLDCLVMLKEQGFTSAIMIVGEDRYENFKKMSLYSNHDDESKRLPIPMTVERISRKDDGLSGTNARQAVMDDDFNQFCKIVGGNTDQQKQMFEEIKAFYN